MKNLIKIVWLFLIMGSVSNIYSQSITWEKIYNKPNTMWDGIEGICNADSGNYLLAGFTLLPSIGYKTWVIKINSNGDTLWTRTVGATGYSANSVVSSGDGGCVLTGGSGEAFSIKMDGNGNIIWERYYGGSGVQCRKIKKTSDGGYIACGRINLQDGYLIKIDSLGYFQWDQTFPSNELKYLFDVVEDFNSGYLMCGYDLESIQDTAKSIILRTDSEGKLIWEKKYLLSEQSAFYSLNKIDGMYIVGGAIGTVSITIGKVFYSKLDSSGNIKFTKIFETMRDEYFREMKLISVNKFLITMSRDSGSILYGKAIISDSLGNIVNQRLFPTTSFIDFKSTLLLPNGDILFTGVADFKIPAADEVGYTVRTDSTLFYKTVNVNENEVMIDENFKLYQNYPNPFNPVTKIQFDLPKSNFVTIKIYDVLGKEISTLVNEFKYAGKYESEFDGSYFPSGIYYYSLSINGTLINTKKLILLK